MKNRVEECRSSVLVDLVAALFCLSFPLEFFPESSGDRRETRKWGEYFRVYIQNEINLGPVPPCTTTQGEEGAVREGHVKIDT